MFESEGSSGLLGSSGSSFGFSMPSASSFASLRMASTLSSDAEFLVLCDVLDDESLESAALV